MLSRIILDQSAAFFTIAAFITAFSIFVAIAWGALRMKRLQVARFESLPFDTPTPGSGEREQADASLTLGATRNQT